MTTATAAGHRYRTLVPDGSEIDDTNRHLWLGMRRDQEFPFLGASRWAAAIGVSPYGTPLGEYSQLLGLEEPVKETARMRRGHYLQPWCLAEYQRATGDLVAKPHGRHEVFYWGPQLEGLSTGATLDAISESGLVIECKSHGWRQADSYGDTDSDAVPVHVYVQAQAQMRCSGYHDARVVVAIDGEDEPRIYTVPYSETDSQDILERLNKFAWHVRYRTPPPYTSPEDEARLKRLYTWDKPAKELEADAGALLATAYPLIVRKQQVDREARELDKEIGALKGQVLSALAGAQAGIWRGWTVEVKQSPRKAYAVPEGVNTKVTINPPVDEEIPTDE